MRITWIKPEDLIEYELKEAEDEGKDVAAQRELWSSACSEGRPIGELRRMADKLLAEIEALPCRKGLEEVEPSDLERIRSLSPRNIASPIVKPMSEHEILRKVYGGWLGRAAGCLLGKPVEGLSREGIAAILKSSGNWPLHNYFTEVGVPQEVLEKHPWNRKSRENSLRENIVCMPEDDDMNFPMLNLYVLETYGEDFDSESVGEAWLGYLPVLTVFTAERVAYMNFLNLLIPPETATHRNPYREWIGAQIRADLWGWVCPGDPATAAELAWRDARLSHVRNGIYGEMFVAAMVAAAFYVPDPLELVEIGLSQIPEKSRLSEAVKWTVSLAAKETCWEKIVDSLYERFGHYHWVHTINNAALVVASLIHGAGDFEKTICSAVSGGWDTDCNGATVGSIIGTMFGSDSLPDKWIEPLNGRVRSSLKGFDNIAFEELAQRTVKRLVKR